MQALRTRRVRTGAGLSGRSKSAHECSANDRPHAGAPPQCRTVVSVSHTKKNVRRDGKKAQAEEKAQKITSGNFRTSVFFGTKNPRIFPSGQRHRTDNSEKPYKSLSVTRLTKDIFLCFGTRPDRARPKESTRFAFPRRPADENGGPFVGRTGTPHTYLRLRQSGGRPPPENAVFGKRRIYRRIRKQGSAHENPITGHKIRTGPQRIILCGPIRIRPFSRQVYDRLRPVGSRSAHFPLPTTRKRFPGPFTNVAERKNDTPNRPPERSTGCSWPCVRGSAHCRFRGTKRPWTRRSYRLPRRSGLPSRAISGLRGSTGY